MTYLYTQIYDILYVTYFEYTEFIRSLQEEYPPSRSRPVSHK